MNEAASKCRDEVVARFPKGRKIAALTAYSYPFARLLDEAGVDLILVGDSLGMVEHGSPDTVDVTLEEMAHHVRIARRGVRGAVLAADLPAGTYTTSAAAIEAARVLAQSGADAVKIEGGAEVAEIARGLVNGGFAVIGHIGMLPQRIREEGRYRIKGKTEAERDSLLEGALALQEAGVFCVVLELVERGLAGEITRALRIPTIGIGSGAECDGQILVTYDLIGLTPWFRPAFAKPKAETGAEIDTAVRAFCEEVRFPKDRNDRQPDRPSASSDTSGA